MSKKVVIFTSIGLVAVVIFAALVVTQLLRDEGTSEKEAPVAFSGKQGSEIGGGQSEIERCIADWEAWRTEAGNSLVVMQSGSIFDPILGTDGTGEVAVIRFKGGECGVTVAQDPADETFGSSTVIDRGAGFETFADTERGKTTSSLQPELQRIGNLGAQFVNASVDADYAISPLPGATIVPTDVTGESKSVQLSESSIPADRLAYAIDASGFSKLSKDGFIDAVTQFAIDFPTECPKSAVAEIAQQYGDGNLDPEDWSDPSFQVTLRGICQDVVDAEEARRQKLEASSYNVGARKWYGYPQAWKVRLAKEYLQEYGCPAGDNRVVPEQLVYYTDKYMDGSYSAYVPIAKEGMDYWCEF